MPVWKRSCANLPSLSTRQMIGEAVAPNAGRQQRDHGGVRLPFPVGVDHAALDDAGARQLEADPLGGRRRPSISASRAASRTSTPAGSSAGCRARRARTCRRRRSAPRPRRPDPRRCGPRGRWRRAIGSPLLLTTRPRITFSGASRKLRAVVPAFSMRRSAISVASAGAADAHEVRPRAGAQAQVKAAVLAGHLLGDGGALEPDADLRALRCGGPASSVTRPCTSASGRSAVSRRMISRRNSCSDGSRQLGTVRHGTAHSGARREQKSTQSPVVLRIAERRGDRVGVDQRRRRAPAPRTRRSPRGAPRSARRACRGWRSTRWARDERLAIARAAGRRHREQTRAAQSTGSTVPELLATPRSV